ncbi:MAG: NADH-quinone oxidoreductase subunit M [Chitinophagaceae bacterium]|nr:NADH-quinone oxidoreductase subunit M [Chitinophagaceae bacterium]
MSFPILSTLIWIPILGIILLFFIPKKQTKYVEYIPVFITGIQFLLTMVMTLFWYKKNTENEVFQFIEKKKWISLPLGDMGTMEINYYLGVDGLSLPILCMSSLVLLLVSFYCLRKTYSKNFFYLFFLECIAIYGTFLSLDFFLFYVFFELVLLPMYFLIGIWGGEKREYASIKFFLYTLLGSLFILMVMICLAFSITKDTSNPLPQYTFDIIKMTNPASFLPNSLLSLENETLIMGISLRKIAFLLLCLGFSIKLPLFPFHTWLPDAHVEAPTPVSVILASILLKMGGYGIIRIALPIFPDMLKTSASLLGILAVISIIYAGLNALAQKDLKKMIAYSSVSQMGFVILGIASGTQEGLAGAIFQMVSHGFIAAGLFFLVGIIQERTDSKDIENFSGLASHIKNYSQITFFFFFAALGIPGLSAFIAEFFVLLGTFISSHSNKFLSVWFTIIAVFGLLISATYYLWTLQRMFLGKFFLKNKPTSFILKDITTQEWILFIPLIILILLLGIFPNTLLEILNPFTNRLIPFFNYE